MKKKILFAVISSLFIFTASGCKRHIRLKDQVPTVEAVNKIGKFIKNVDLDFNDVSFKRILEDAIEDIKGTSDEDAIYDIVYKVYLKTTELVKKYYVAEALYDYDRDNDEYYEKRELLSDAYYEYESFRANLFYELKDNREFLKNITGITSDEDLDYEINLAKKKKDEKYTNLKKEIDDIIEEFDDLDISMSDSKNNAKISEILFRFVNKNKELSEYLGFDSYVEYKDIMNRRIYTKYDTENFIKYVKKYILPELDSERNVLDIRSKINSLTSPEYNYLIEFIESSAYDKDYYTINLAKDYARKMGGSYYKTFYSYLNEGHIILANNEAELDSGYTNQYLSYFGSNYQDVDTIIHEFGHYYSINNGDALSKSLDLEEFYSQGNEFLFMSYLEQNSYSNVKNVYDVVSSYKLVNACLTMFVGAALREYEEEIYSTEITSQTQLVDIWSNLKENEYDDLLADYWKYEVRYDNYYISYATSVTGALSLYTYSKTDFTKAKEAYISACRNENYDDDLVEVLTKNNLSNPFDEETFKKIVALIEEKRK